MKTQKYYQQYTFCSDPDCWLEVPRSELDKLGLSDKISTNSYQNKDLVYLEEDCDAAKFIAAYTASVGNAPILLTEYQKNTPICQFLSYTQV